MIDVKTRNIKISITLLILSVFALSGCYKVGDKTSQQLMDSAIQDLLPSEKWYTQHLVSESIKLAFDGHYYNRLEKTFVE